MGKVGQGCVGLGPKGCLGVAEFSYIKKKNKNKNNDGLV